MINLLQQTNEQEKNEMNEWNGRMIELMRMTYLGRTNEQTDEPTNKRTNQRTNGRKDGGMGRGTDKLTNDGTDKLSDVLMNGQTSERTGG